MALRITKRRPDGSLARLGFLPPADPAVFFFLMGGRFLDESTGQITLASRQNVDALKRLISLEDAQGGRTRIRALRSTFGESDSGQNPIATGRLGMMIDGEWVAMHLEKYAPGADYGIGRLPHPASRPDLFNMAFEDGDIMIIPTGAKQPDAAWEFMRWMQLPRQQDEYAAVMNNLPSIKALLDSPNLTRGSRSKQTLGFILKNIAVNTKNAHFFPTLPVTRFYRDMLENAVEVAELHQKTPEQALADAQRRVEQELRKYQ